MSKRETIAKIEQLELTSDELDATIKTMKEKNYPVEEINNFVKQRWQIWNEIHKLRKGG